MITLVLEASTYEGSVALLNGTNLLAERMLAMRGREREALMAAVGEVLAECDVPAKSLGEIVCGAGPGSFTSLRIAASIAKGLALATHAPLYPISSLTLLAASFDREGHSRILAAMDAMRGESYVQLHEVASDGTVSPSGDAGLVPSETLAGLAERFDAVLVGPTSPHHAVPRAGAARHITNLIHASEPANLAAWEPMYGRLAEAQVKWEAAHGRPLPA